MTGPAPDPHLVVVLTRRPGSTGPVSSASVASLLAQTYPSWSLVEGPTDGTATGQPRLPLEPPVPDGVGAALVLTLPDGAVAAPGLLADVAAARRHDGARLVTWDLQLAGEPGAAGRPALRFAWSPEVLLSADYPAGAMALDLDDYRRAARAVPPEVGVSTWSLLLHLPVDLAPTRHLACTLATVPEPPAVPDEAAAAIVDAGLRARGVPAACRRVDGVTRLDWDVPAWPSVTIVIPTRHNETMLGPLLESLASTSGPAFDVVVVDNGARTPEHEAWYERSWGFDVRVTWWQETPFHYGRVNNAAVRACDSEVVVLLNDDTVVVEPGWLAELVGLAVLPGVGVVGTALLDREGRFQHAGVWLGLGGYAGHLFAGMTPGEDSLLGPTSWYRNVLAVTAACLAVRRETYLAVGGLDEAMVLCGSDVTLGLDVQARGLRNICSPHPALLHLESATRSSAPVNDQLVSLVRYQPWHDAGDPYGNPRLSLRTNRPTLRPAREVDPVAAARSGFGLAL